ncbi:hypothetical protein ACHWQZ_G011004 [Mnemiopsis leidyi]
MVNELDKKLVSKENRPLDKYVDLTKDYDDDFITLSAAHIEDAKYGRGHYGKAYAMESNSSSVRVAYNITFSVFWHYFTILIMVTHCLLVFYITNKPYYIILETACVLFYVLDVILHIIFYTPQTFFRISKRKMKTALKSKLQFILTVTFICDLGWTYYSYFYSDESLQEKAIPFQFLRSFVFILKIRTFYHFFMVVIKTIARILRTIFVIILYVLFFSCIAVHIFGEIYENSEDDNVYKYEFSNAARAFVRMFVLITTENYPDVMEPVYRYHNVTILYYIIFIYFGVFILTSILLAIVVDNYWTIAKMNVKKERLRGRKELAIAWNLLGDGAEKLSVYDENLLMVFRMLKPKNDDEEIIIFLQQLTGGMNSSIIEYKSWLTRCIDILDLEVERAADEEEGTNLISGPNPPQMFTSFGQSCQRYGFGSNWCSFVTIFQVSTTSNWHEKMQSIIESGAKYYGAVYFITTYIIFHMVIINLFVAISYEAYNKFVSKPKQAKKSQSASNKPKKLTQRIKSRMGKFKVFLNQYTKGTRKSVSSSPRPARRASVTIKRKSLHGMREKISDSSLGDAIPDIRSNGTIEPPKTPDLSSLPREKRHEMMLKQKMQQKGEARGRARRPRNTGDKVGSFAEVVRQYTAKSSEEISLAPGQRIKVLDKAGTKYKGVVVEGPNTGKNGWFPAFVVGSFVSDLNKNASEKKPLPKSESQPKFVRKQNADWTKDIIGPMTIMNPEELKELNKILKANARGSRSSTDSHRGSIDGGASPVSPKPNTSPLTPGPRVSARASNVPMMNIVEEEEEEEAEESDNDNVFLEINKLYSKPMQLPEVVIEQPSIVLEDEEEKEQDKKHLQSPKIHTPEMKAKEKWKKKMANKGKEIPDWARKFMSQTNTKVADSSAIKSPTESEETDPLSRITPGPLTSKEPQPGKSDSLQTESAVQTSKQSNSLLRGLRIKLPSDKDLVVINNIASDGTSPNNNLLVSENRGTESKSTILNIPESPDKNKPVVHVVATPSPTVTVVLPATDETSSQQPEQSQQNTAVAEPETESEKAKNNPESNSNRKFWRRNRRDKVSRSGSLPAALTSTLEKQPPVKRSETEVKIVVQPPAFEHIVDFE